MVLQGCLGVIPELSTHIKEEGEGENNLAQPGRAVGVGALRDIPSIVLDPEVAAELHSLVCGAELWGVVRPVKASRPEQGRWAVGPILSAKPVMDIPGGYCSVGGGDGAYPVSAGRCGQ